MNQLAWTGDAIHVITRVTNLSSEAKPASVRRVVRPSGVATAEVKCCSYASAHKMLSARQHPISSLNYAIGHRVSVCLMSAAAHRKQI